MAFVTDTFTDADGTLLTSHTSDSGATWSSGGASTLLIKSNRAYSGANNSKDITSSAPASADYDVQADFFVVTAASSISVIGRASGATIDTFYQWGYTTSNGHWELYKCVSGAFTLLGFYADAGMTAGVTKTGKLSMVGTAISGYVAGTQQVSVTDSAISLAGSAGVRGDGATSTTGVHLDNFSAADASATPPNGLVQYALAPTGFEIDVFGSRAYPGFGNPPADWLIGPPAPSAPSLPPFFFMRGN